MADKVSGTFDLKQIHELNQLKKLEGQEQFLVDDGEKTLRISIDTILGYMIGEVVDGLRKINPSLFPGGSDDDSGDDDDDDDDLYKEQQRQEEEQRIKEQIEEAVDQYIQKYSAKKFPLDSLMFSMSPDKANVFKSRFGGSWSIIGNIDIRTEAANTKSQMYLYKKNTIDDDENDIVDSSNIALTAFSAIAAYSVPLETIASIHITDTVTYMAKKFPLESLMFALTDDKVDLFNVRFGGKWEVIGQIESKVGTDNQFTLLYVYKKVQEDEDEDANNVPPIEIEGPTGGGETGGGGSTSGGGGGTSGGTTPGGSGGGTGGETGGEGGGSGSGSGSGSGTGGSGTGSGTGSGVVPSQYTGIHVIDEGEEDIPIESREKGHFYIRVQSVSDLYATSGIPRTIKVGSNMRLRMVSD